MRAHEIEINSEYQAKVDGELIRVKMLAEKPGNGGWSALNLETNKKVFIPLTRFILSKIGDPEPAPDQPATKKPATRKPKAETPAEPPTKRLSQMDAAIKVLGEEQKPMGTKEMVEAMVAKGYWSSAAGKTPHATLYSAILREITTKGDESRFVKTDRGHFQLRSA